LNATLLAGILLGFGRASASLWAESALNSGPGVFVGFASRSVLGALSLVRGDCPTPGGRISSGHPLPFVGNFHCWRVSVQLPPRRKRSWGNIADFPSRSVSLAFVARALAISFLFGSVVALHRFTTGSSSTTLPRSLPPTLTSIPIVAGPCSAGSSPAEAVTLNVLLSTALVIWRGHARPIRGMMRLQQGP